MKNKSSTNYQKPLITKLSLSLLVISIILILTGCSTTNNSAQKIATDKTSNTQPVTHNVNSDPVPLTETEKALSLEGYGAKGALSDQNLSIIDMLRYAVQDEYLALDEYLAIINQFGSQKPYTNIISAEQTHLAFLEEVYLAYGLDFPADTAKDLIVPPTDLLAAAKTGVQAEIDNIAMYELFLTYGLPDNIIEVFSALLRGSQSHLAAFQKQVSRLQ